MSSLPQPGHENQSADGPPDNREGDPAGSESVRGPKPTGQRRRRYAQKLQELYASVDANHWLAVATWFLVVPTWVLALDARETGDTARRAWIAPIMADFDRVRGVEQSGRMTVRILYQNTGKEPALDLNHREEGVAVSIAADWKESDIHFKENRTCEGLLPTPRGPTTFPSTQLASDYEYDINPARDGAKVYSEITSGIRTVYINGCFAYTTLNKPHQSGWCFFLAPEQDRPFSQWRFKACPTGHSAS